MPNKNIQQIDSAKVNTVKKKVKFTMGSSKLNSGARVPKILIDGRAGVLNEAWRPMLESLEADFYMLGAQDLGFTKACFLEELVGNVDAVFVWGDTLSSDFNTMLSHGLVPILPEGVHAGAKNYEPSKEKGNAFLYQKDSIWKAHEALVRSIENFQFSYDWKNIVRQSKELIQDES